MERAERSLHQQGATQTCQRHGAQDLPAMCWLHPNQPTNQVCKPVETGINLHLLLFIIELILELSVLRWVSILFFFFVFSNSANSSLPQVPENPAAKKGKGKACVKVSTSFNPLDQTCIHPESYHVVQRYRTHRSNMCFQNSSCILTYISTYLPLFVILTGNHR